MLKQPEALSAKRHANLKYKPVRGYAHAAELEAIALSAEEVGEASKHYPIVFPLKGDVAPMAIVGMAKQNRFVGKNGAWRSGAYVPAMVRAYPFALGKTQSAESFALVVDRAAPQFSEDEGQALFEEGKPGKHIEHAQQFLKALHLGLRSATTLAQELVKAELLVPVQLSLKQQDKEQKGAAFRVIDRKKLAALPDETRLAWAKNGLLALVHLHLNSLSNVGRLGLAAPIGE